MNNDSTVKDLDAMLNNLSIAYMHLRQDNLPYFIHRIGMIKRNIENIEEELNLTQKG